MHLKILLAILLFSCVIVLKTPCQIIGDETTNPEWEFYSENLLSTVSAGKGYTGVGSLGDLSSLSINPACISLEEDKRMQIYAGSTFKTNIPLYSKIPEYSVTSGFPSIILGGIYNLNKNLEIGFVYHNDFSYKDEYKLSTYDLTSKFASHSFTIPIVYNRNFIRFGADVSAVYFRGDVKGLFTNELNPEGYYSEAHSSLWKFMARFGAFLMPTEYLSFGITYSPGFVNKTDWYINDNDVKYASNNVYYPDRFGVGTEIKLMRKKLRLSFDYIYSRTSSLFYLKNRNDIHFGVEYLKDNNLTLRCGFFTLYDFRNPDNGYIIFSEARNAYDEYFVTFGASYLYKYFAFNLAVMDSHLILNSNVSHTKINGSVSFNL
jgi:hypothetical protein